MKRCSWSINRFSDYIERELPDPERLELEAHLAECGHCAEEFKGFQKAHAALLTLTNPVTSRPVLGAVRARIRQEDAARAGKSWKVWGPVSGLALATLAAVAVYLAQPVVNPASRIVTAPLAENGVVPNEPVARPSNVTVEPFEAAADSPVEKAVIRNRARAVRVAARTPAARPKISRAPGSVRVASSVKFSNNTISVAPRAIPTGQADEARIARRVIVDSTAEPRIVVVAYNPPKNSSLTSASEAPYGNNEAEIHVSSIYAPDGSVRSANVIYRVPLSGSAETDNVNKDIDEHERTEKTDSDVLADLRNV